MKLIYELCIILWMCVINARQSHGVTCRDCKDVGSPGDCRDTLTCGPGEVCFTREFTDHLGLQGFRMGCEDKNTCDLLEKAKTLFGKRSSDVNSLSSTKCFLCCSSDECNADLCKGSVGGQIRVTTAKSVMTTTTAPSQCVRSGCPENFVRFKDHCYMFSIGTNTWQNARKACQLKGADLVSITSKEEHDFLRQQAIALNASYIYKFYTGASYSQSAKAWQYTDGSPFIYQAWGSKSSCSFDRYDDYFIVMLNPVKNYDSYDKALFECNINGVRYNGVICKRRPLP